MFLVEWLSKHTYGAIGVRIRGSRLSDHYEADLERYQRAQSEIEFWRNYYGGAPLDFLIDAYNDGVQSVRHFDDRNL